MTQDPNAAAAKNYAIDSARIPNLYVQLAPTEEDPQHVLVRPGTY